MAPVGEKLDSENKYSEMNGDSSDKNLWAGILSEVQSTSTSSAKLPSNKSVIVIGDNESGKTSLVARLQGTEDPKKGAGLEYHYINVKDDYRDDQTRLGVWILDGDSYHANLLSFAQSSETFEDTLVVLVASMSQPWAIMESLQRWSEVLNNHINRLRIPPETMQQCEEKLVKHFQEYKEPDESSSASAQQRKPLKSPEGEVVLLPLGETTLTHNMGVPIIVVITKSDSISTLEKEHDYTNELFDFIQQSVRKFCLNYGAALFYTSVKEGKNCEMLYKYIIHRMYGFPFTTSAYVVDRDSVYIPAGWDNEKKISILDENFANVNPNSTFEEVIQKPITRKPIQREAEVQAEDDQVFLMKLQTLLTKQPTATGRQESPMRTSTLQKSASTASPRGGMSPAGLAASAPKKLEGGKAGPGATNEGVLANFFNSLLTKKTGAAPPGAAPTKPGERAAVSRDAAAELDRINRSKASLVTTPDSNAS